MEVTARSMHYGRRSRSWRRVGLLALLGLIALGLAACSKDKDTAASTSATVQPGAAKAGAAAPDQDKGFHLSLTAGLAKAGFKTGTFEQAAARPYQAQACARGEVDKLDVLLCRYESGAEADRAKKALERFIGGAVTGAVRSAGPSALAVSDRNKIDLQGKRINALLKAFVKLAVGA